jgi:cytoskeletal protein CcmA (bactofilin family)
MTKKKQSPRTSKFPRLSGVGLQIGRIRKFLQRILLIMKKKTNAQFDSPDRLNIIVEGSKIIGDMFTESNLRIDGEVKGNVSSVSKVVIGKTGIILGNLTCVDADIEGGLIGLINVESLTVLRATARIQGEITTAKLSVEEGAQFSGNCKMSNFKENTKPGTTPAQEDLVY